MYKITDILAYFRVLDRSIEIRRAA